MMGNLNLTPSTPPRVITLDDYAHLDRPGMDWLIPELLPHPSLTVLFGPPKVGKSFLALLLAFSLAHQTPFLDYTPPSKPCTGLFLQLDTAEPIWRDRLLYMSSHGYDISGPIYHIHPDDLPRPCLITSPKTQDLLSQVLASIQPDYIILDILRELHVKDENDATQMKIVMDAIQAVFHPYTTILLHHARKSNPNFTTPLMDSLRGSSYLAGRVDSLLYLDNAVFQVETRFSAPRTYDVDLVHGYIPQPVVSPGKG